MTTPSDYDQVVAQVAALYSGKQSRRRKFRKLEVTCPDCGQVIAEVMKTHPFPSVVYREGGDDRKQRVVLITSLDRCGPSQLIQARCRCCQHCFRVSDVAARTGKWAIDRAQAAAESAETSAATKAWLPRDGG